MIHLEGFAVANYRSFGAETQYIRKLDKVNVFIGKNNCGKSNVLRFCKHLSRIQLSSQYKAFSTDLDHHNNKQDAVIKFGIPIYGDGKHDALYSSLTKCDPTIPQSILDGGIWLIYCVPQLGIGIPHHDSAKSLEAHFATTAYQNIHALNEKLDLPYVSDHESMRRQINRKIHFYPDKNFNFEKVEAFRSITNGTDGTDFSGKGLLPTLRHLQNPVRNSYKRHSQIWNSINQFVSNILNTDAELKIPSEENVINVQMNGRLLPLDSLGTGIHELIILASTVTLLTDCVVGIEEPEIHFHPELQKKFLRYLRDNTSNQYMITSHSNAVFDIGGVNIYQCKLIDGCTTISLAKGANQRFEVLTDLGYKYSDMLISNFIIWVEGPSDRIYIRHWLNKKDSSLIEGLHYTIMFYGGGLLSHLDYDPSEVDEFINLSTINRNAAIVMDSDKSAPRKHINGTKKRVKAAFEKNNQFVWVTKGREIENYIHDESLVGAFERRYNKPPTKKSLGPYENISSFKKKIDKIGLAHEVCANTQNFDILDLDKQISSLVKHIDKANQRNNP